MKAGSPSTSSQPHPKEGFMTYATYPSLRDRVVLVTGGGERHRRLHRGALLRPGLARGLRRHRPRGRRASAGDDRARRAASGRCSCRCDLRDIAALRGAVAEVRRQLGPIRVLVNNAAHDERHALDTVTPEYWDDRLAVNLRHQFFAAQAVYPDMAAAGGGAIVNLGSTSWMVGQGGMPGLHGGQVGGRRADARARARPGPAQHPGHVRRARLDHDRAAAQALAHPGEPRPSCCAGSA